MKDKSLQIGTERNLVVASSNKGATTVIGFMDEVNCLGANELVRCFFKYLSQGYNIDYSLSRAKSDAMSWYSEIYAVSPVGINTCVYRGAWNYTFVN